MKKNSKRFAFMIAAATVSAGTAKADVIAPATFDDAAIVAHLKAGDTANAGGNQVAFINQVPEPASLALLLAGLPVVLRRRK